MSNQEREQQARFAALLLNSLYGKDKSRVPTVTADQLDWLLPNFLMLSSVLLSSQYEVEGLRAAVVVKRWQDSIEVLKERNPVKSEQLPFDATTLWDFIQFSVTLDFIESLEEGPEEKRKLEELLLKPEHKQELAEFIDELKLLLPEEQLTALTQDIDWGKPIPQEKLLATVEGLLEAQRNHLFSILSTQWKEQMDIFQVTLFVCLEFMTRQLLLENWAKRVGESYRPKE